ncbi:MAG TPA: hypothetical protein VEU96_32870 [Bryobacteraceae bacterium]|nr:hypothetical protein [Bryobacteraceae bacterium]
MGIDTEQLRRHYGSLSDDALAAIKREDLVDVARDVYDEEVDLRERTRAGLVDDLPDEEEEVYDLARENEKPNWIADAAQIFTEVENPGAGSAQRIDDIRSALEAAGIPCFVEACEVEEEASPAWTRKEWRVFVPGNLNQRAMSTMERDVDNPSLEETWRVHLENLSDSDLRAMEPKTVYCGLYDRIERIERVYQNELARRRLK